VATEEVDEMAPSDTKLGFVGLGHMGGNMASRLLGAGYTVYGEDRSRELHDELIGAGLHWCNTPREVGEQAQIVFTSLPDDAVLRDVAAGADGVLAGLREGSVWVDMSTVSPDASRELAGRVRERGAELLDAPVSGSVPQVQSGTLTIMVGGDEKAYQRVAPILSELGSPSHVGDNGNGLALKLAINISLAVQMLAFSEGLLLATRSGVDAKRALDVMESSPIGSPMLKARASLILDPPTDDAWFDLEFMHKDIELALDAARSLGIQLASATSADGVLEQSIALGYGRRDLAVLFEVLQRIADGAQTQAAATSGG
jgi:3-hydroxyisobutyrate dehydrogenase-like beta-hydroxyacid dehydrogenase